MCYYFPAKPVTPASRDRDWEVVSIVWWLSTTRELISYDILAINDLVKLSNIDFAIMVKDWPSDTRELRSRHLCPFGTGELELPSNLHPHPLMHPLEVTGLRGVLNLDSPHYENLSSFMGFVLCLRAFEGKYRLSIDLGSTYVRYLVYDLETLMAGWETDNLICDFRHPLNLDSSTDEFHLRIRDNLSAQELMSMCEHKHA